jgi:hypothetical protein
LRAAYTVFHGDFDWRISLQGLGYFDDGDLPSLPKPVKERLMTAIDSVIGEPLPPFEPLPGGITPAEGS